MMYFIRYVNRYGAHVSQGFDNFDDCVEAMRELVEEGRVFSLSITGGFAG